MGISRDQLLTGCLVLEKQAKLKVTRDGLEAMIIPTQGGALGAEMLQALPGLMDEAGIIYGRLANPEPTGQGWAVARGAQPQPGENGRIEFVVEPPGKSKGSETTPGVGENPGDPQYVDPHLLGNVVNVRQGQVLARKVPPTPGIPGTNVFGEKIAPKPGNSTSLKPGPGVAISDDGAELAATLDGKLELEDGGKVSVQDEWTISGPVDVSTGHVTFVGRRLVVTGSIQGGFRVKAHGDLEVSGNLDDGCKVEVLGNLAVGGIIRAEKSVVEVEGNVSCLAIEYAPVSVGGNLEVRDYVLDARCHVRGDVRIIQGKGLVAGGAVFAGRSFSAKVVGTDANVITRVCAGHDPAVNGQYKKAVAEIETWGAKRTQVEEGLETLKRLEARGPLDKKRAFIKKRLTRIAHELSDYLEDAKRLLEDLDARLKEMHAATVQILERAYTNASITIDNTGRQLTRDVTSGVVFSFRHKEVVMVPLSQGPPPLSPRPVYSSGADVEGPPLPS